MQHTHHMPLHIAGSGIQKSNQWTESIANTANQSDAEEYTLMTDTLATEV